MVSLIQSNFANFGSGVVPDGAGFVAAEPRRTVHAGSRAPNALAPRKRPLHTIIPGFMSRGDIKVAFGIMGGWNQSQAHVQFISNVVDHGMNIQAALEAARVTKLTFTGLRRDRWSRGVPASVRRGLADKGHEIDLQGDVFEPGRRGPERHARLRARA